MILSGDLKHAVQACTALHIVESSLSSALGIRDVISFFISTIDVEQASRFNKSHFRVNLKFGSCSLFLTANAVQVEADK